MAIRLLPFRQYNEQDVVNLFSLDAEGGMESKTPTDSGTHDAGVLVMVSNGDLTEGPTKYTDASYMGKVNYPHVGKNQYPVVPLKVAPATGQYDALGVTLKQTLTHDENGEKLIYYPQKALELNAVKSGDAVPVLTRGVITLDDGAFSTFPNVGDPLGVDIDNPGQMEPLSEVGGFTDGGIGLVLATGERVSDLGTDYFGGETQHATNGVTQTGKYAVIKLKL